MSRPVHRPAAVVTATLLLLVSVAAAGAVRTATPAVAAATGAGPWAITVAGIDPLGVVTFPSGTTFRGTQVGGLSGLAWDRVGRRYLALSDDRSDIDPARFYTLGIDVSDGSLDDGDVRFRRVTTLRDPDGRPYEAGALDPEGIAVLPPPVSWLRPGRLVVASEGDAGVDPPIDPFVDRFTARGRNVGSFPVPDAFRPGPGRGVRTNLAFESLTVSPTGWNLYTATEAALVQDGPAPDVGTSSPARIVRYDVHHGTPIAQYVYVVDPVPDPPVPADAFRVNGLVELLALDEAGTLLALERAFSVGVGNTVRLFEISVADATNVHGVDDLDDVAYVPVTKRLLLDFEADLGIVPDNLEALALGVPLADGRVPLFVVSDDNFNPVQTTQFIALGLHLVGGPAG